MDELTNKMRIQTVGEALGGVPVRTLCVCVYADESRVLKFKSRKFYGVYMQLANEGTTISKQC
jgi:hypothetical protein